MALQHHPSEMMYRRALDHFTCLYEESAERAKIMAIACHPYLSGVPHRIGHVQRTFEEILSRDGVVAWDGSKILELVSRPATPARIGWRACRSRDRSPLLFPMI